jgi:hypothetical protein
MYLPLLAVRDHIPDFMDIFMGYSFKKRFLENNLPRLECFCRRKSQYLAENSLAVGHIGEGEHGTRTVEN